MSSPATVPGGQVGGGAQDVAEGRSGLGASRGRQVCEGVGVDVVEDQAVGGVQESRVDSAQVGGASGRYQQDAAAGGARGAVLGTSAGSLPSSDLMSAAWWAILLRCWSVMGTRRR